MDKRKYPRVLIIGQTFSGISGSSITLRNLFSGWPKDKIAVASYHFDPCDAEAFNFCSNNYKLGKREIEVLPGFNMLYKPDKSGIFTSPLNCNGNIQHPQKYFAIKKNIKKILILSGLNSIRFNYKISDSFKEWYQTFNPQIVYTALGDIDLIRFAIEIKKINNIPLAIHIWDDWPNTLSQRTVLKKYWQHKIDKEFRELLSASDLFLSISEEMSRVYLEKYRINFFPFHNPINLDAWNTIIKNKLNQNIKSILYVGKINSETIDLLLLMAKVVETLPENEVLFHIYSPDKEKYNKTFLLFSKTKIMDALPHTEIITKIKNAYILFLPLGFSEKSINYTRLSMPTKTSEYMVSRVPILLMAPSSIALTKYAKQGKWAHIVDNNDVKELNDAILKLLNDLTYRNNLVTRAYSIGAEQHNATRVREKFRALISEHAIHE